MCTVLTRETGGSYHVILDEGHFKELLMLHVKPPPASCSSECSLIRMGECTWMLPPCPGAAATAAVGGSGAPVLLLSARRAAESLSCDCVSVRFPPAHRGLSRGPGRQALLQHGVSKNTACAAAAAGRLRPVAEAVCLLVTWTAAAAQICLWGGTFVHSVAPSTRSFLWSVKCAVSVRRVCGACGCVECAARVR